jgi:hypothetical protein
MTIRTATYDDATHVVVLREPTEVMHVAAVRTICDCNGNYDFPPRVYRAMIAAAPTFTSLPNPDLDLIGEALASARKDQRYTSSTVETFSLNHFLLVNNAIAALKRLKGDV